MIWSLCTKFSLKIQTYRHIDTKEKLDQNTCFHFKAEAAVDALNEKEFNGRKIFVGRAQKKAERLAELKRRHDQIRVERMSRYQVEKARRFGQISQSTSLSLFRV